MAKKLYIGDSLIIMPFVGDTNQVKYYIGDSEITFGDEESILPNGYTLVPYIKGSVIRYSPKSYFDTGLFADDTTRIIVDCTPDEGEYTYGGYDYYLFSSGADSTSNLTCLFRNNIQMVVKAFSVNQTVNKDFHNSKKGVRSLLQYIPDKGWFFNSETISTTLNTSTGVVSPGHILLLAKSAATDSSNADAVDTTKGGVSFYIHGWEIYTGGVLVSHLYPAVRNSDSEVGLYDVVRNVFLNNLGTKPFIAGEGEWTPYVKTWIGYPDYAKDTSIVNFTVPDGITEIGNSTFSGCTNLESVTMPDTVTTIGSYLFQNLSKLTSLTIGSGVTTIGSYLFQNCYGITSFTIPDSVTSIGANLINNCTNLQTLVVGNGVTTLDYHFCYSCTKLTSLTIGNSVTTIKTEAFSSVSKLSDISIPASVINIEPNAFGSAYPFLSITVDSNNPVYDSRNNCNAIIETATNKLVLGCVNTIIPSGITSIGNYAFYSCSRLSSINIPDSVTSIGENAYNSCISVKSDLIIPANVTTIGLRAFNSCNFKNVIIYGNSVSIGQQAFVNCTKIEKVILYGTSISITSNTFGQSNSTFRIYVPHSADHSVLDSYKAAANWSSFADRIFELNPDGSVPAE